MRNELLQNWMERWCLSSSQAAKVLKIQKSRISEYMSETAQRDMPPYIQAHIETFGYLDEQAARKIIQERLKK